MALKQILEAKKRRLERDPLELPRTAPTRAEHAFAAALSHAGPKYIFECKKASPSAGLLAAEYDPVELAESYVPAADAISVLTEPEFFGGCLEDLASVSLSCGLPTLRKDFILGPEEVVEARHHGAQAVLLMLSILDDETWLACARRVAQLGMDAITEVHSESELERALRLSAPIIGINNRNLKTLETDLGVTQRLAPMIPAGPLVIAESGIRSRHDVWQMARWVDGFLVGTSLMRARHPGRTARELAFGRVKVCGLTSPDDAISAWEAGAVYGGLNFATESPRAISLSQARHVVAAAPLIWIGIFRDQTPEKIIATVMDLRLDGIQLHGCEDRTYILNLRERLPEGCLIWKAVPASDRIPSADHFGADRVLIDSVRGKRLGGTGVPFDPTLLKHQDLSEIGLAGGVTPENVAHADALKPWLIDVNSGVEQAPGKKDRDRLVELFAALKAAPGSR